jgi:gluconokinase
MGVAGSGKTTLGKWLAEHWQCAFLDADDLHSPDNISKMTAAIPLTDEDRRNWASEIRSKIDAFLAEPRSAVVACSALGENTRSQLGVERPAIALIHLVAPPQILRRRLEERSGHFFPASLLENQLDSLEPPEKVITISSEATVIEVADLICTHLTLA